ncbi:hypothetical protein LCGC14_0475430 [marine sediment metagenome]|uniref:Uncharacterized protein n=1 Tax=marine sediment metagenome TaxID=412755 RepID=A0A0F9SAZ4_9ZZZZ
MKRLSKTVVDLYSKNAAVDLMCTHGVKNAKRIAYKTWKWLKAEEARQKEKSK